MHTRIRRGRPDGISPRKNPASSIYFSRSLSGGTADYIERAPSRRSFSIFRSGAFPFISSRTISEILSFPDPSTVYTFFVIPIRSFGYREKSRSFFRYPPVARNVSRSVRTFRARRWRSYEASPAIEKSPRARASTAARAAAIPEAIARSTPRNVYPLLIRNPAASPTRNTPSPIYRDFIPSPSSGTRWAEYSETFPPLISRWTLGWRRNVSITAWTSTFLRARSSEETTSPREREALFVYRNPPPRRPMLASPAYTIAAPSFSP